MVSTKEVLDMLRKILALNSPNLDKGFLKEMIQIGESVPDQDADIPISSTNEKIVEENIEKINQDYNKKVAN
jgi:hypothetical protein